MFKEKDVVFVLLLISLLIRLFFFLHFQDPSDSGNMAHALLEPSWSMSKFVGHHVPPLSIYLIKISRLFNDTAQGVRLPNLILGSLMVIPFYYLVRVIYNQEVAFFSGLALAVFYKHIQMSASSCAEIPLYTFLFTALALFFWFKETKKPLFLLLSSISLNLATMSRYESWVFIPLLTVFLLKEKKRYLIGFFLLSLAFPLLWMYLNYKATGSPIEFFVSQTEAVKEQMLRGESNLNSALLQKFRDWFRLIQEVFPPLLFWPGVFGLCWSLFKKKRPLVIAIFTIVSLYIFKLFVCTLVLDMRYVINLSLFFLPFIAYGIYSFLEKIKLRMVILYCFILILSVSWLTKAVKEYPPFPAVWNDFIEYFRKNLNNQDKVAVVGSCYEILVRNLARRNSSPSFFFIGDVPVEGTKGEQRQVDTYYFRNYAKYNKTKYVVIDSVYYPFSEAITINKILECFPNAQAECVFRKDNSFIYKITHKGDQLS